MSGDTASNIFKIFDLTSEKLVFYDISRTLGKDAYDYPGDQKFIHDYTARLEHNDPCTVSSLTLSAHSGTHLEAPAHFLAAGATLDRYDLRRFILPAKVIHYGAEIPPKANPGSALLFKTANAALADHNKLELNAFSYMKEDMAKRLIDTGAALIGWDAPSVEYGRNHFPIHTTLLRADVLILEGLNLDKTPQGDYLLLCLPLKIHASEASPVRAVLVGTT